jgi:hypothetical protein
LCSHVVAGCILGSMAWIFGLVRFTNRNWPKCNHSICD